MSLLKTSIRFFDDIPVRSVWDEETAAWRLCAMDVVSALVDTANPRVYWATVKRRHSELFANCKQLKLTASDGKKYNTDTIDDEMFNSLMAILKSPKKDVFQKWIASIGNSLDEKSRSIRSIAPHCRRSIPTMHVDSWRALSALTRATALSG